MTVRRVRIGRRGGVLAVAIGVERTGLKAMLPVELMLRAKRHRYGAVDVACVARICCHHRPV